MTTKQEEEKKPKRPPKALENQAKLLFKQYWERVYAGRSRFSAAVWSKVDKQNIKIANDAIRSLFTDEPHGLLLIGPIGTGKTSLLWLLRREYIRLKAYTFDLVPPEEINSFIQYNNPMAQADDTYFLTHFELVRLLRETAKNEAATTLSHIRDNVVFIDDFGRAYDTDWNAKLQFEFFNYRYEYSRPTFVSTNLSGPELRTLPEYEAVVDRFGDRSWMRALTIGGESKRKEKGDK